MRHRCESQMQSGVDSWGDSLNDSPNSSLKAEVLKEEIIVYLDSAIGYQFNILIVHFHSPSTSRVLQHWF